jgi:hypothetical protein
MLTHNDSNGAFKLMGEDVRKSLTEAKMAGLKASIDKDMGSIKGMHFVSWTRFDQADQMVYLLSFEKKPMVRCAFIFDKKGNLEDFALTPLQLKEKGTKDAK